MYFPQSQITTDLYTNGGELIYALTLKSYTGYYFKTLSGKYYTGKNQNDGPNNELIFVSPNITGYPSSQLVPQVISLYTDEPVKILPYYLPTFPTQTDYQIGEFVRYFSKKTNEIKYIEINQNQYDLLEKQDPQIEWTLYQPFYLNWQLTGNKDQVAKTNQSSTLLAMKNQRLPRLDEYLQFNWTKYYQ